MITKLARTIEWAGQTFTADTPVTPMTEPASGGYFTVRIEQHDRQWFISVTGDDVVTQDDAAQVDVPAVVFRTHTDACVDNAAVRAFDNDHSIASYPSPEATVMGREYLASDLVDCICTSTSTAVQFPTCDYGPAGETATRITDGGEMICTKHAREHYGSDWKTETRKLTARKIATITSAQS